MRNRRLTAVVICLLVALNPSFIGTSQAQAKAKANTLKVTITAGDSWFKTAETESEVKRTVDCGRSYKFGDSKLSQGQSVKISNESGKQIGLGKTVWKVRDVEDRLDFWGEGVMRFGALCVLEVTVKNLKKAEMYQIMIGTFDAGAYSYEEMVQDKWKLTLTYS
jgi:hypothetical protein